MCFLAGCLPLLEERLPLGCEKTLKRLDLCSRQQRMGGHALEARGLGPFRVDIVRDRRRMVVQGSGGLPHRYVDSASMLARLFVGRRIAEGG